MKTRHILLAMGLFLLAAVSCSKKEADHYLDVFKLSTSYVTIPQEGGSQTITVTATEPWTLNVKIPQDSTYKNDEGKSVTTTVYKNQLDVYDWVTITPTSGSAGTYELTFTCPASDAANKATFFVSVGDKTQNIIVAQGIAPNVTYTVAEALEMHKSGKLTSNTVKVKGIISQISEVSPSYGNATYFISDDGKTGNEVEIYRGYYLDNQKFTSVDQIGVGDEVVVAGVLMDYKGICEFAEKNSYIVSIKKSLVTVSPASFEVPYEGGTYETKVLYSGDNLDFSSDVDWITIQNITTVEDTTVVTMQVAENTGEEREGVVTLTSSSSSTSSSTTVSFKQMAAPIESSYTYTLATSIEDGKPYLIAATDGTNYFVMEPLASSKNYGYPSVKKMTAVDGVISMEDRSCEFIIASNDENGYIIYGTDNRYYYQSGTYKSLQVSSTLTDDAYWTIEAQSDGTFKINSTNNYWLQYSTGYTSYGAYATESGLMPCLLEYTGTYEYELVTSADQFTDGNYLIASTVDGKALVMQTLAQSGISKAYGYPKGLASVPVDGVITLENDEYSFAIASVDGGYHMMGSDDNYYYQSGTYKSFQTGSTPDSTWSFEFQSDGTFKILSSNDYWVQYDTGYSSYGVYTEDKGVYPCLYKEKK